MGHEHDDNREGRDITPGSRDEDLLWRSIVDNYGDRVTLDPTADEPTGEPPKEPTEEPTATQVPAAPSQPEEQPAEARDWLDAYDDPEDHFVPPEPERVPTPEPRRLIAWAGVFGVPVAVLVLVVLQVSLPPWASMLCLAWFVGGFGYLVATMRREPPDNDWDDGARL
ncbi:MAG TPA: hypothetical protein VIL10_13070 [Marmoricola sp.]